MREGEGASLRVAGHHKKSRRMRTAIHSLRSNCPDETRDDVPVGWACDHDESCTTAFSVLGVGSEARVWLRRSGGYAGRCAEDC